MVGNLQNECQRLTNQNARLEKLCRKLNKKLRTAEKKAQESNNLSPTQYNEKSGMSTSGSVYSLGESLGETGSITGSMDENLLDDQPNYQHRALNGLSRKQDIPIQGIIKFNPTDLQLVVNAILGCNLETPRCATSFLLFMALRHTDASNDDALLKVNKTDAVSFASEIFSFP
jgi:hypothetical protein